MNKKTLIASVVFSFAPAAMAETQFEVEANLLNFQDTVNNLSTNSGTLTATITIDEQAASLLDSQDFCVGSLCIERSNWSGGIQSVAYSVYDNSGALLGEGSVDAPTINMTHINSADFGDGSGNQSVLYEYNDFEFPINATLQVLWSGATTTNFEGGLDYPVPAGEQIINDGNIVITDRLFENESPHRILIDILVSASITAVRPLVQDADGDGINDDVDACPNSNTSNTVVIGDQDSGVDNVLLADGCTVSDLIAEVGAGASNHGQFVKAVAAITNDLKAEGIISGKEKGKLQSAAASSK